MTLFQRVRTKMGCRMEGMVINRTPTADEFALYGGSPRNPPWTDGTYRWPYTHENAVWVYWNDGTYGWTHQENLEVIQ